MAIGSLSVEWLTHLRQRDVLPGGAVLDLGPQDVTTTRAVVERAAIALWGKQRAPGMVDAAFDGAAWRPGGQLAFYKLFGATSYRSVDLSDPRADLAHDLNQPLPQMGPFDIITDFGTCEHVFSIGTVFESIHRLLKVGGVALFTSPSFGFINHGFFNVHPLLFSELAHANRYQMLDYRYIDNMLVRCRAQEERPGRPFDFDSLPIRTSEAGDLQRFMADVALRFKRNLEDAESMRLTDNRPCFVFDLSFVALRKTADSPQRFATPFQGGFGAARA